MSQILDSIRIYADKEGVSQQQFIHPEPVKPRFTLIHPIQNELVLNVICYHLPKKDWKSARLVNKTWYSTLQSQWRNEMIVNLGLGMNYWDEDKTKSTEFLEQQMLLFVSQHPLTGPNDPLHLSHHPIRNISIEGLDGRYYYILLQQSQTRFWELYGDGLKYINFHRIRIYDGAFLKRLLFELTPNLEKFRYYKCVCVETDKLGVVTEYFPQTNLQKNLKFLEINTANTFEDEYNGVEYKPKFPIGWMEFFSMFPNIQILKLEFDPPETNASSDLLKVFETIDVIRTANRDQVLNITELRTSQNGFAHVDVIENQSLFDTLQILILHMNVTQMKIGQVISLIQTLKTTLRQLTLFNSVIRDEYFPYDMLPQGLTKLSLCGPHFSSLEFLSNTPDLEELELSWDSILKSQVFSGGVVPPLLKLQKFKYTTIEAASLENMHILTRLMPNVKICVCNVDAEGFQEMCQRWSDLEHLDLRIDFENENFFVENLIQLKCLKSLKMNTHYVSDKSVFNAFLMMPSLTRIQLSDDVDISEEGFQALEGKLYDDIDL